MTLTEAMKLFLCAVLNDGTTPNDIEENTAILLWQRIAEAFNTRFNVSGGSGSTQQLGELTLVSTPGATTGTTHIVVTGASSTNFRYISGGTVVLPTYNQDLSAWTTWDGVSDIAIDDGTRICVAEVSGNLAIAAGIAIVNSNI